VRVSVDEHGGSLTESGLRGERGLHQARGWNFFITALRPLFSTCV
jgi:hypothetical protein